MKKIILIFLIFSITSCSILIKPKKLTDNEIKEKILANLSYFKNCKASGIINLSLKNFELKSNSLLRKKNKKLRIDIFSSGLLGLSPSPQAQILFDDSLNIFLPAKSILYVFKQDNKVNLNFDLQQIIKEYKNIEKTKTTCIISLHNTKLVFDKKFNLILIQYEKLKIILNNYRNNLPYILHIFQDEKEFANLIIDNWSFPELKDKIFRLNIPEDVEIIQSGNIRNINKE
ncbi:MAG: hypothetical protein KAW92_09110 [Candidatus Cloacimonetes bacterium]|nr:hypothetical protein [Candidatus Cloacimonadota bacterium]